MARGEVRTQYAHIIDMVPTVLDLLGIEPPRAIRGVTQAPIEGVSFAHALDDPRRQPPPRPVLRDARPPRHLQGWLASGLPWPGPSFAEAGTGFGNPIWAETPRSSTPPAGSSRHRRGPGREPQSGGRQPQKLIESIGTWYVEAGKYEVMLDDGSGLARMIVEKPLVAVPRNQYTYVPVTGSIPNFAAPRLHNRPHSITATVVIPEGGAEGVLFCQGTAAGGYSLYVKGGRLHYVHNYVARQRFTVSSPDALPSGRHELRFEFEPTGQPDMAHGRGAPGRLQLYVDGRWSRAPTSRTPRRSCSTRAASAAATTRGPR